MVSLDEYLDIVKAGVTMNLLLARVNMTLFSAGHVVQLVLGLRVCSTAENCAPCQL